MGPVMSCFLSSSSSLACLFSPFPSPSTPLFFPFFLVSIPPCTLSIDLFPFTTLFYSTRSHSSFYYASFPFFYSPFPLTFVFVFIRFPCLLYRLYFLLDVPILLPLPRLLSSRLFPFLNLSFPFSFPYSSFSFSYFSFPSCFVSVCLPLSYFIYLYHSSYPAFFISPCYALSSTSICFS